MTCTDAQVEVATGATGRWPLDAEITGNLLYLAKRIAAAADFDELTDLQSAVERERIAGRMNAEDRLALLAVCGRRFRDLVAASEKHPQHVALQSARMLARSTP